MGTRKEDEWGPLKRPVRGPGIPVAPRDHRIDAFFPSLSAFVHLSSFFLLFATLSIERLLFHRVTQVDATLSYNANIDRRYSNTRGFLVGENGSFFEIVCFCFLYTWKARNLIREKLIVKHEELCNRGNFALEEINVSNGLQIFLFFNILECFSLYIFFFFFFNLQKWFEVISKHRIGFKFFLFFNIKMSFSLFFYDRWIYFSIILR